MNQRQDADAHVRAMMKWHFSPDTGCPFWLERRDALGFDPMTDITGVEDLLRFPNVVDQLRDVPVQALMPRGLDEDELPFAVYETGGTTGAPKRFLMYGRWFDDYMAWENSHYPDDPRGNSLAIVPSGPHMIGDYTRRLTQARGGVKFTVDMDPRWVRTLLSRGDEAGAKAYVDHVIAQARLILAGQDVPILLATPPMILAMAAQSDLLSLMREKVRLVIWSGAHLDVDTLEYLETTLMPEARFRGSYGSTTVLSGTVERPERTSDGLPVYDSMAPYVIYRVVDEVSGRPAEYGSEGFVVMNYLTRYGLVVNSRERDRAIRLPSPTGVGDSLAGIHPVSVDDSGKKVIEGVY